MYRVTFVSSIFGPDGQKNEAQATLQLYLDTLVKANCISMAHRELPPMRYLRPRISPDFHKYQDALQLEATREGASHDLAAYRAAELIRRNVPARATYHFHNWGTMFARYECIVEYPSNVPRELVAPTAFATGTGVIHERPGFDAGLQFGSLVQEKYPLHTHFVSSLFAANGVDRAESHATLQLFLDMLTGANRILRKSRRLPPLYNDGVRYQAEPIGEENWLDVLLVRKRKQADCEDLAADRAAELADEGAMDSRAVFEFFQDPRNMRQLYHCKTIFGVPIGGGPSFHPSAKLLPNGLYVEDPSKILGMRGAY